MRISFAEGGQNQRVRTSRGTPFYSIYYFLPTCALYLHSPSWQLTCFPLQLHSLTQRSGGSSWDHWETGRAGRCQRPSLLHAPHSPHRPSAGNWSTLPKWSLECQKLEGRHRGSSFRVFNGMGLPETFAEVPECTLLNSSQKPNATFSVCMSGCFQCPDGRGEPRLCSLTGMF